ncbi:Nif3-like dinuclear metal center hexameric protein [Geosporobacter ferrireducens]|uniref:GTP cyclohydrolase 1 type 2 homolog n=1 Tax=Geosporobacter ferrireducens TaxID=1424294 RepID=A0A1D8GC93_9FIRM|nr:Nif3-like dinuclear metal center hexameric protein [Geosporobacter ferrireducens]AOT68500.1 Nif3-like dinuclear metal center hexameric protein [Geosporobacter ferrireducens]MTI53961.1 Nif3-like dinuclear metal center hexameric protein [Geosporobacter ferrireducens]
MAESGRKIIEIIEKQAPLYLAESWDNVGLQLGNPDKLVKKIMVCLEVTEAVLQEADAKRIDMIVAHHPLIFKPMKKFTTDDPLGRMIYFLIQKDILLYCAHTNLDMAYGGLNDLLAFNIGLSEIKSLTNTYQRKYFKIVVFVPESHEEEVRSALCSAGAGFIGNYSDCSFKVKGEGTFRPLRGANPYIGSIGEVERLKESRVETIIAEDCLQTALKKMLHAHPYEEVAYDLYPLGNVYEKNGLGRMGYLKNPEKLLELCNRLKRLLGIETIKIMGDQSKIVKKVGLCTGSGAEFIYNAYQEGCDCFITGDVKYHEAQYAQQLDIPVIDAGHFDTENYACGLYAKSLEKQLADNHCHVDICFSSTNINPFCYI